MHMFIIHTQLIKANLKEVPTVNDTYSLDYSDDDFVLKKDMVHVMNEEGLVLKLLYIRCIFL